MALTLGTKKLGLQNLLGSNKSVILVKLTDSSLRTIEQYLKKQHQLSSNVKPTIEFQQNTGTISIPVSDDGRSARFSFALTSTDDINGPQGGFECLQSTTSRSLDTLGPIQEKINIQALDDTYTRFGEKMVEVKKDNEKRSTVFIDRPGGAKPVPNRPQQFVRKAVASSDPRTLQKDSNCDKSRPPISAPIRNRYSHSHDTLTKSLPAAHQVPPSKSATVQKIQEKQQNSEIIKRPLRERIVHLLALRPFKKPELLSRIARDGIREKDRSNIFVILKQVSTMKDNSFHLLRHIWNDVSEDWPFYTEEERQFFRRRKPQNLTPPNSDGSTGSSSVSGLSATSSHPASPQPPSTFKRVAPVKKAYPDNPPEIQGPTAKKKRTSNYVASPQSGSDNFTVGGQNLHDITPKTNQNEALTPATTNEGKVSGWLTSITSEERSKSPQVTPASSPDSQYSGNDQEPVPPVDYNNARDYLTQFVRIKNDEQRRLYKAEFNKCHNIYKEHHQRLEGVSKKFADLENQLQQAREGSELHKKLKLQIWEEYHLNKKSREEFQYLHEKLAHIKALVIEYDKTKFSES